MSLKSSHELFAKNHLSEFSNWDMVSLGDTISITTPFLNHLGNRIKLVVDTEGSNKVLTEYFITGRLNTIYYAERFFAGHGICEFALANYLKRVGIVIEQDELIDNEYGIYAIEKRDVRDEDIADTIYKLIQAVLIIGYQFVIDKGG